MNRNWERICSIENCGGKHYAKGFCSMHYRRARNGVGMATPKRGDVPAFERLISRVIKGRGPTGECWEFTGSFMNGYGQIKIDGKMVLTHRFSWEHHNDQKIPDGLFVLHACDNRPCVNPDHLRTGTHQDNMADRQARGRYWTPKGETNPNSKLSNDDVLYIYRSGLSNAKLAKMSNAGKTTINHIKTGGTWSHVTGHRKK